MVGSIKGCFFSLYVYFKNRRLIAVDCVDSLYKENKIQMLGDFTALGGVDFEEMSIQQI